MSATPEKISKAIKYVVFARKPVTLENVNRYMQSGDKITQDQLDAHIAAAGTLRNRVVGHDAETTARLQQQEASHATVTDAPNEPPENVVQLTPPGPSVALCQRRLAESQVALRTAGQRVRELRGALAAKLALWQGATGTALTPEMAAREFIRSETQLRQDRKDGIAPPRGRHRAHRSVIDAVAAATNYGPGAGGGNAFRRVVKLPDGSWTRPRGVHDVGRR